VTQTIDWNGADADWYSDNWVYPESTDQNGPPPGAGAAVFISNGAVVTVNSASPDYRPLDVASIFIDAASLVLDQDETIPSLTLAGIDGGGIITTGSGVGPVTLTVTNLYMGAKYLNGVVSDGHIEGDLTVLLTGTGNIGGTLGNDVIGGFDGGTATLEVASTGSLTFDDNSGIGADANGRLINYGVVEQLAAASGTTTGSTISARFTNESGATLQVDAGVLNLTGSDNLIGGTIQGGGVLNLAGTSTLESDVMLANDGTTIESSGDTTLDAIVATIPSLDTVAIDGGTVTGSASTSLTVDGTVDLVTGVLDDTSGGFRSTPDIYVSTTGSLNIGGTSAYGLAEDPNPFVLAGSAFIQNGGIATLGSGATPAALEFSDQFGDLAIFQNTASGTFTITDSTITSTFANAVTPGYNFGYFYNDGTLNSISDANNPAGENVIQVAGFNSDGIIDVQQGTLFVDGFYNSLNGGQLTGAGTLVINPYVSVGIYDGITSDVGTLQFDAGDGATGLYQVDENFTQNGALVIDGPTLQVDNELFQYIFGYAYQTYTLTVTGLTTLDGGTLEAGTLLTSGGFSASFISSGAGNLFVEGATLENSGNATIAGGSIGLDAGSGPDNSGQAGLLINDLGATITLSDVTETYVRSGAITGLGDGSEIENYGTIVGQGEATVNQADLTYYPDLTVNADSIVNDGTIVAQQGQLDLGGALTGTGTLEVDANAVLAIDGTVSGNTVDFAGIGGWLQINDLASGGSQDFNAAISGFTAGDAIGIVTHGLGGHAIDGVDSPTFDAASDTTSLTLTDNGQAVATLTFDGDYAGQIFSVTADPANSGVDELNVTPCYCPGTLILTPAGEVPVEALAIGDRVITVSGEARPIRWIGRRSYAGRFALGKKDILPIRVNQGALGENLPKRDLWVSPRHALYLQRVLIEACDLVNGRSITQAESVESVVYIHIELDSHDVILAEGAPAESFIDDNTRGMFHNAHEYQALYPNVPAELAQYCAPRLKDGYQVEAIRREIADRAGIAPGDDGRMPLRGYVDFADARGVGGWAQNPDHPEARVCLDIYVDGALIGQTLANRRRGDLAWAGLGSGHHGFLFVPPEGVMASPENTQVRRSLDRKALPFSAGCVEGARLTA
jgi:hypothetical protein